MTTHEPAGHADVVRELGPLDDLTIAKILALGPTVAALVEAHVVLADGEPPGGRPSPGPVVELGPGTGPVTQALLQRGLAPERLILVEYDPAFCRLLERRFPGVRVIQGDAYDLV